MGLGAFFHGVVRHWEETKSLDRRCLLPKERLTSEAVQVLAVAHRLTLTGTLVTDFKVSLSHDLLTV